MNMKHQSTYLFRDILERVEVPVNVEPDKEYVQIGIRSHGKGLFYKEPVLGKALGNKQVFWIQPNCFILNVVFAWEQAITKTTENEIGMIGSHRFPMYRLFITTRHFASFSGSHYIKKEVIVRN